MKKAIKTSFLLTTLMVAICITSAKAQTTPPKMMHYSDMVGENPNAEADIKLVTDYVNSLVAGEVDKAVSMLASGYKGYGPGPDDSATAQMQADSWKTNNGMNQNRKIDFVAETFIVKSGQQEGHWVSTWGTYTFTQNGKNVKLPYQYTAHVKNGKIDMDVVYFDQLSLLRTLGYTITPPSK